MSKNICKYNIILNSGNNNGYNRYIGPTEPASSGSSTDFTSYIEYISSTIQINCLLIIIYLVDLNNFVTVRTNLDVYSIKQTNNAIKSNTGLFIDLYSDISIK
jgi:hypothetical protein